MWQRLGTLLRRPPVAPDASGQRLVALEREAQALRLDLAERERTIAVLSADLERARKATQDRTTTEVDARFQRLLADLAAPLVQIATQVHLVEVEQRPVAANDILAIARRLLRTLEDHGLRLDGPVGAAAPFDPAHHELLAGGAAPTPGEPIVIRFAGTSYRDIVLRKAGVERTEK
jgi:molecular chaperone GrpE (heat shock protein)